MEKKYVKKERSCYVCKESLPNGGTCLNCYTINPYTSYADDIPGLKGKLLRVIDKSLKFLSDKRENIDSKPSDLPEIKHKPSKRSGSKFY